MQRLRGDLQLLCPLARVTLLCPSPGHPCVCPAAEGPLGHSAASSWHVVLPWQREGEAGAGLQPSDKVRRDEAGGSGGIATSPEAMGKAGTTVPLGDLSQGARRE